MTKQWEEWAEEARRKVGLGPRETARDIAAFGERMFRAGLEKAAEIVNKNDYRGLHVLDILGNGPGYKK